MTTVETKLGSEIVASGDNNAIILGTENTLEIEFNKPVLSKMKEFFEGKDSETLANAGTENLRISVMDEFCSQHPEITYWVHKGTGKKGWEREQLEKHQWVPIPSKGKKISPLSEKLKSPMGTIMIGVRERKELRSNKRKKENEEEDDFDLNSFMDGLGLGDDYKKEEDEMFRCINDEGLHMEDLAERIRSVAGMLWGEIEKANPNVESTNMIFGDAVKVPLFGPFEENNLKIQMRRGDSYYKYEKWLQKCREIQGDDLIDKVNTVIVKEPKKFKKPEDIWYTILRFDTYEILSEFFKGVDIDSIEVIGSNIVKDTRVATIEVGKIRKVEYYTDKPLSERESIKENFIKACRSINVDSLRKNNHDKYLEADDFFLIARSSSDKEYLVEADGVPGGAMVEPLAVEIPIGGMSTEYEQGDSRAPNQNTALEDYSMRDPIITEISSGEYFENEADSSHDLLNSPIDIPEHVLFPPTGI